MEGVGSTRLGRSSARYGPTAVFNGPVRKWKKKWVHVSPPSTVSHHNSLSHGHNGNGNSSSILLCRWTPLPSSDSISGAMEEPPKRKFRYTPVAVLEEERKKEVTKRVENEAKTTEVNQPSSWLSSKGDKVNVNKDLKQEIQDSNMGHLDLGLCLKGQNENGQNKDQAKTAGSGAFWKMDQQ
ncbi:hypothetical protein SLE2022_398060 [Rubroshorea leprosula]